jgi:hypothetical protein
MNSQHRTPRRTSRAHRQPHSWSYAYAPFHSTGDNRTEIPAFEIFDDEGYTIANTNEGDPRHEQEKHAKLIACAPRLLQQVEDFVELITAHLVHGEVPGEAFREEVEKSAKLIRSAHLLGAGSKAKGRH